MNKKVIKSSKATINGLKGKLGTDNIEELFAESFENGIATNNGITSFECDCERDSANSEVKMEVHVYGFAGSVSQDDFENGNIECPEEYENGKVVPIEFNGETANFHLIEDDIQVVNATDYLLTYIMR